MFCSASMDRTEHPMCRDHSFMRIVPYIGEVLHRREVGAACVQTVREMGTDRKTLGWYGEAIPVAESAKAQRSTSALRCFVRAVYRRRAV